ncbi:MAG: MmcB family DNA repair protein [Beijerinckiaceae bacterium]
MLISAESPMVDGRQSERALLVRRGTLRLLASLDAYALPEVTLASGRRADLVAVGRDGMISIIEIKSSREDLLADRKWPEYRAFSDRLFFATLPDVDPGLFPNETGLIVADGFGGAILRDAPAHPLPAATRKALLIRLARAGAARLSALTDPSFLLPENL